MSTFCIEAHWGEGLLCGMPLVADLRLPSARQCEETAANINAVVQKFRITTYRNPRESRRRKFIEGRRHIGSAGDIEIQPDNTKPRFMLVTLISAN